MLHSSIRHVVFFMQIEQFSATFGLSQHAVVVMSLTDGLARHCW